MTYIGIRTDGFNQLFRKFTDIDKKFDKALKGEIATRQIIETCNISSNNENWYSLYDLFSLYILNNKSLYCETKDTFINHKQSYYKTKVWRIKRDIIIGYYGRCVLCGRNWGDFHVHHNSYKNVPCEEFLDLTLLCGKCHEDHHQSHKRKDD